MKAQILTAGHVAFSLILSETCNSAVDSTEGIFAGTLPRPTNSSKPCVESFNSMHFFLLPELEFLNIILCSPFAVWSSEAVAWGLRFVSCSQNSRCHGTLLSFALWSPPRPKHRSFSCWRDFQGLTPVVLSLVPGGVVRSISFTEPAKVNLQSRGERSSL